MSADRESLFHALRLRLRKWWSEPITVKVEVRKSPDWDGDAARHRRERGW